MNNYPQAQQLLVNIEAELKRQALWNNVVPTPVALASTSPFCIDTMGFTDWLQFVFLVKMRHLIVMQSPLPENMAIYPMATEAFQHISADTRQLLVFILEFDQLLTNEPY